jgi:hypothetical protein
MPWRSTNSKPARRMNRSEPDRTRSEKRVSKGGSPGHPLALRNSGATDGGSTAIERIVWTTLVGLASTGSSVSSEQPDIHAHETPTMRTDSSNLGNRTRMEHLARAIEQTVC